MNLSLLVLVPLITAVAVLFCRSLPAIRWVSLIGVKVQLLLCFVLLALYWKERAAGNGAAMLFEYRYAWFPALNIWYHVGVDGIFHCYGTFDCVCNGCGHTGVLEGGEDG